MKAGIEIKEERERRKGWEQGTQGRPPRGRVTKGNFKSRRHFPGDNQASETAKQEAVETHLSDLINNIHHVTLKS